MEIDSAKERDKIFERDGARLIVDKKSFLYLNGSELDYAEELMSAGFKLVNPNAKRTLRMWGVVRRMNRRRERHRMA